MLSVRELQETDLPRLLDYWFTATPAFLEGMGVDLSKMPHREDFRQMLLGQLNTPLKDRSSYCVIWLKDGEPVGHSNTNPSYFGKEAKMHLHLWEADSRQKGLGSEFVKLSLPWFFNNLQLQELWCEPYALNPAPNKTLEKLNFRFVKEYITTPGFINFEQPVKQWQLTRAEFEKLQL